MSEQNSRSPKNKPNGKGNTGWSQATEENSDFFEDLVEKCAIDAGAPFEPEVLKALASLKQENNPAFESLRARLKRNGCRVAALDEAIAEINGENERGPNQTGLLISLVDDIELFHTADKTAYADIQVNGHRETWSIKSEGFSHWLDQRFFEKTRNVPNSDTLRTAITNIEGRARYEGSEQNVFLRVGSLNGKMYLDLCDGDWRAIEVDTDSWRVVDNPPIRFRRAPGMQPLPIPTRGGSIDALRGFLNVGSDAEFVLAVSWILAAMRSRGPYPILVLSGEQGSAKSTFSDIMRAIVDPSTAPTRSLPRKDSDLFIAAANAHVLAFDNISILPNSTSDALCRLSTRGAHATRELFSDQKEVLLAATRPIIMNGIEEFVTRPDLADRSLFLTLDAIPDDKRRAEEELWQDFEAEFPCILGVLLDAMVEGIRRKNEIQPPNLPRMADFALWASACETAFWEKNTFWQAYSDNRDEVIENIVESDPVANALRAFIARQPRKEWQGTASELLKILTYSVEGRISRSKGWASSANVLSGRLRRAATFLRNQGVEIEFTRGGRAGRRIIRIRANEDFFDADTIEKSSSASSASSVDMENRPFFADKTENADDADDADDLIRHPGSEGKSLPPIINCGQNRNMASLTGWEGSTALSTHPFAIQPRKLYLGDNLPLLRTMASNSVDLIAADPPFNTGNKLVGSSGMSFLDKWKWRDYVEGVWLAEIEREHEKLGKVIRSAIDAHSKGMGAYLCFMAVRLLEMKRILKDTGSIYIHCDPHASHYLKQLMDIIFGRQNFIDEIVWNRVASQQKGSQYESRSFGRTCDYILHYAKTSKYTHNEVVIPLTHDEILQKFPMVDEKGRRYSAESQLFLGRTLGARPNLCYTYKGVTNPHESGWRVSKQRLMEMDANGEIIWREGKMPLRKIFAENYKGKHVACLWTDIPMARGNELTGYPTQKPLELLDRIIQASSNEGDLVLDPFCGSGTTLIAAENLGRRWIGMDESEDACKTAQKRFGSVQTSTAYNRQSVAPIGDASSQALALPAKRAVPLIISHQLWVQEGTSAGIKPRTLYLGDNLLFLRAIASGSIDVIATDPPFNTGKEWVGKYGERFPDKWRWRNDVEGVWLAEIEKEHEKLGKVIRSAIDTHSEGMGAYICFMAMRLLEMKRILKPTGSIYLHCDSIALHYLKQLMDAIFGHGNFRNQITWKRSSGKNQSNIGQFGRTSDYILFYSASPINREAVKKDLDDMYVANNYTNYDERHGMWKSGDLTGPSASIDDEGMEYKGYNPASKGRAWCVPRTGDYAQWLNEHVPGYSDESSVLGRLNLLDRCDMIHWTKNGVPRLKQFIIDGSGQMPGDIWTDISAVSFHSKERTGYPTQKPIALYKRLVLASSKEGDIVLDPFCGSGTTLIAAEQLGRHWIGMDESEDACRTAQNRFESLDETDIRNMDSLREEDAPTPTADNTTEDEETGGSGRWNWFGKLLRGNSPGD